MGDASVKGQPQYLPIVLCRGSAWGFQGTHMGRRSVAQRQLPGVGDLGMEFWRMTRALPGEKGGPVFQGQHEQR